MLTFLTCRHACRIVSIMVNFLLNFIPPRTQTHRSRLDKFREMVMPRQFQTKFRVEPENTVIVDKLSEVNERYEKLKIKCNEHTQHTLNLLALHDKYRVSVETVVVWIDDTQTMINQLVREPVSETPDGVNDQIDKLRVRFSRVKFELHDILYDSLLVSGSSCNYVYKLSYMP